MRQTVYRVHRRGGWRRIIPFGLGVLALPLAACDTDALVNLPDPDLITRPIVEDTANLPEIRNGVVFEFARAVSGPPDNNATPGIVGLGGLLADELWYASTFTTMREIDARGITKTNTDLLTEFQYLQRARNLAERAAELYAGSPRENTPDHALVTNIAGFTYLFFAENFCSGVPFSRTTFSAQIEYGPGQTTQQMFELAIARFDAAIAIATAAGADGTTQLNAAKVGKARAQLGLGQFAAAATTV